MLEEITINRAHNHDYSVLLLDYGLIKDSLIKSGDWVNYEIKGQYKVLLVLNWNDDARFDDSFYVLEDAETFFLELATCPDNPVYTFTGFPYIIMEA